MTLLMNGEFEKVESFLPKVAVNTTIVREYIGVGNNTFGPSRSRSEEL